LLLRETKDPLVTAAVPKLKVGRWNVEGAVTTAEGEAQFRRILGSFQFRRILGSFQRGREDLRVSGRNENIPKESHAYRKKISSIVRDIDEESNLVSAL